MSASDSDSPEKPKHDPLTLDDDIKEALTGDLVLFSALMNNEAHRNDVFKRLQEKSILLEDYQTHEFSEFLNSIPELQVSVLYSKEMMLDFQSKTPE